MRLASCCLLIVLSTLGTALAQDTNFATGPQYLTHSDPTNPASALFARSISTPSMSLAASPLEVGASNATGSLIPGAGDHDVLPPSSSALPKIDLFPIFYGEPPASVVEISFPESEAPPSPLPASILDTGVDQITSAQGLRARGYGITLSEAAAYGKAHRAHATHVYTNADIDRLQGGS
jgi:hypothetical protein